MRPAYSVVPALFYSFSQQPIQTSSYGSAGERPQYCAAHRTVDMLDVKSKACEEGGCDRRSSFGVQGKSPRFCAKHRPYGTVDVVHRLCETLNCQKHPTYGFSGKRRRFCSHHTVSDEIKKISNFRSRALQLQTIALILLVA